MTFAEEQKYRDVGTNPVFKIQRFKERKRQKFLTQEELARLGAALNKAEQDQLANPYAIAAIRLLIFTEGRTSEILTLEWAFIDLDRRTAFLPDSKTDDKPIVLNDAAVAVLSALPRLKDNPFVIVGHVHGRHMVNMQKPWKKIKELAELDGCRIHDLRHTYASVGVNMGGSLPIIGKSLGHARPQTTDRYAHLIDAPVRELTQKTGQALLSAMNNKPQPLERS